jgi:hypothetical protein
LQERSPQFDAPGGLGGRGIVEIDFRVEDAVRGSTAGIYTRNGAQALDRLLACGSPGTDTSGHPITAAAITAYAASSPGITQSRSRPLPCCFGRSLLQAILLSGIDRAVTVCPANLTGSSESLSIALATGTRGLAARNLQKSSPLAETESLNGPSASK